jgi:formate-dependent nitrite reductase membrane component NrfD
MLFFISAVGTGISTLVLIALLRPHSDIAHSSIEDLETADNWAMGLELVALAVFFVSLGGLALPLLTSTYGITILVVTGIVGLILPLLLHFRPVIGRFSPLVAACLALVGGFALRWAIVFAAQGVVVAGR